MPGTAGRRWEVLSTLNIARLCAGHRRYSALGWAVVCRDSVEEIKTEVAFCIPWI
jgi:hypothetical protein